MKNFLTTIILVFTFFFGHSQSVLEQKVSMQYTEKPILEILQDLEVNYGISFSYGNLGLKSKKSINHFGTLKAGLDKLFSDQNLSYKEIGNQIVLKSNKETTEPLFNNIKGQIIDGDSEMPLFGATVVVHGTDPIIGTAADVNGYFKIERLPIGRYDLKVNYIGYESTIVPQVVLTSGKELFLNVLLKEAFNDIQTVDVIGQKPKDIPLNEMATLSARSFTVDETKRYAASVSDPARMVQSYAGVTSGGDDLSNEIIIRGNSAKGLLWRLEGIEIPNPNHYGSMGGGGGGISMISSNVLSSSDFYTSAFPAEYGNAISGVFDLKFRNGNYEKREGSIQIGLLGIEASTEGFFSKKSKASYLINYRYSTLGLLGKFLPTIQEQGLNYQDLSFKINVPTDNAGTFSLFGLGGINETTVDGVKDTLAWADGAANGDFEEGQSIGMLGASHKIRIKDKTYFKTIVMSSADLFFDRTDLFGPAPEFTKKLDDISDFKNFSLAVSVLANHKFNAKNTLRIGAIATHKKFNYDYRSLEDDVWITFFDYKGSTQILQSYAQWKYRFHEDWTINTGVHFTYLTFNNTWAIDPRIGLKWNFKPNQSLGFAAGIHSKPEHISTYFIERISSTGESDLPNRNLKMMNAFHGVLGYDLKFAKDFRLKLEGYYQYLYNVPISDSESSNYSILNSSGVWDIIFQNDISGGTLVSKGTGFNYGIDITLEKFFTNQYYFMVTSSLFDSKFKALNKKAYPTRYASNFSLNVVGGKEFSVGKKRKNTIGLNGRFAIYGGNRDSEIDLEASRIAGEEVVLDGDYNGIHSSPYYRFDIGFNYRINGKKASHSFMVDVQNVTNHYNVATRYYDSDTENIETLTQNGAFPIISYKVEF